MFESREQVRVSSWSCSDSLIMDKGDVSFDYPTFQIFYFYFLSSITSLHCNRVLFMLFNKVEFYTTM